MKKLKRLILKYCSYPSLILYRTYFGWLLWNAAKNWTPDSIKSVALTGRFGVPFCVLDNPSVWEGPLKFGSLHSGEFEIPWLLFEPLNHQAFAASPSLFITVDWISAPVFWRYKYCFASRAENELGKRKFNSVRE